MKNSAPDLSRRAAVAPPLGPGPGSRGLSGFGHPRLSDLCGVARRFADAGASRRPMAGPGGQLDVAPVRVGRPGFRRLDRFSPRRRREPPPRRAGAATGSVPGGPRAPSGLCLLALGRSDPLSLSTVSRYPGRASTLGRPDPRGEVRPFLSAPGSPLGFRKKPEFLTTRARPSIVGYEYLIIGLNRCAVVKNLPSSRSELALRLSQ